MAPTVPRKNTLQFEFDKNTRHLQPTSVEVHDWIDAKFGITTDQAHTAYYDLDVYCFFVKFEDPLRLERLLLQYGGTAEFLHRDGTVSTVQISRADIEYKNVRIFNLPPEVEDCFLKDVLLQYGQVKSIRREKWSSMHKLQCYSGVRSVEMHVKQNIPSRIMVCGYRVQVTYNGQVSTCYICHQSGHLREECPKRAVVMKTTLQQRKRLTLAELITEKTTGSDAVAGSSVNVTEQSESVRPEFPPLPNKPDGDHHPLKTVLSAVTNKRRKPCDSGSSDDENTGSSKALNAGLDLPMVDVEQVGTTTQAPLSQVPNVHQVEINNVVSLPENSVLPTPQPQVLQQTVPVATPFVNSDVMEGSEGKLLVSSQYQREDNHVINTPVPKESVCQQLVAWQHQLDAKHVVNAQVTEVSECIQTVGSKQQHEDIPNNSVPVNKQSVLASDNKQPESVHRDLPEDNREHARANIADTVDSDQEMKRDAPSVAPVVKTTATGKIKKKYTPNVNVQRYKHKNKDVLVDSRSGKKPNSKTATKMDWFADEEDPISLK